MMVGRDYSVHLGGHDGGSWWDMTFFHPNVATWARP